MCLKHYNLCAKLWSQNHNSTEQTSWWTTTWRVHNGMSLNCTQHIHKTKHYWKNHYQFNNHTDNQMRSMSIYVMNKRAVSMVNLSFKWSCFKRHFRREICESFGRTRCRKMSWNDLKLFSLSQCCQNKHEKRNTTGYYLTHDKNLKNCTPLHVRSTRCLRSHWSFNRCAILASATPTAFRQT